jgi:hypothetical protein
MFLEDLASMSLAKIGKLYIMTHSLETRVIKYILSMLDLGARAAFKYDSL